MHAACKQPSATGSAPKRKCGLAAQVSLHGLRADSTGEQRRKPCREASQAAGVNLGRAASCPPPALALSVDQFCASFAISRGLFYQLLKTGRGPKIFRCGERIRISVDAAVAWRRQLEAEISEVSA
jgi:hypothetical protein